MEPQDQRPVHANTSLSVRESIVNLHRANISAREISRLLNVNRRTVYRWIQLVKQRGTVNSLQKTGRPRGTQSHEDQLIVDMALKNPLTNAVEIQKQSGIKVGSQTVRNRLHEAGVHSASPVKKQTRLKRRPQPKRKQRSVSKEGGHPVGKQPLVQALIYPLSLMPPNDLEPVITDAVADESQPANSVPGVCSGIAEENHIIVPDLDIVKEEFDNMTEDERICSASVDDISRPNVDCINGRELFRPNSSCTNSQNPDKPDSDSSLPYSPPTRVGAEYVEKSFEPDIELRNKKLKTEELMQSALEKKDEYYALKIKCAKAEEEKLKKEMYLMEQKYKRELQLMEQKHQQEILLLKVTGTKESLGSSISDHGSERLPEEHQQSGDPNPIRLTDRHFPSYVLDSATRRYRQRRCKVCCATTRREQNKKKDTRFECIECDVGLCVDPCFKEYHTLLQY